MNPINYYTYLYPQLTLEPKTGLSSSETYKDIVLRGIFPDNLQFPLKPTGREELIQVNTPIGEVEAIYLPDRMIFERFINCLANKCEPSDIPKTTGAMYISGINCWRKIYNHQEEFLKNHSLDEWDEEFKEFTKNKDNYKSIVLLLSEGYYSACEPSFAGYEPLEWLKISKDIRTYHELTHAVSRKLYADHVDAIRDEIIADTIGTYYATKKYQPDLIKKFLGIEGNAYRYGGRLENYSQNIEKDMSYALSLLGKLDDYFNKTKAIEPFDILLEIEDQHIR